MEDIEVFHLDGTKVQLHTHGKRNNATKTTGNAIF